MENLILEPTATAQWQRLVRDAQKSRQQLLNENLESYLVFVLMRCVGKQHLGANAVALDWIAAHEQLGGARRDQLQVVGDHCLLISGLYPERARKRNVTLDYYVNLGRGAYVQLAEMLSNATAELFHQVADGFVALTEVLHRIRAMTSPFKNALLADIEQMQLNAADSNQTKESSIVDHSPFVLHNSLNVRH